MRITSRVEELYEHAKGIIGGKQEEIDLGEPEDGEGGDDTIEVPDLENDSLVSLIKGHAELAKVKLHGAFIMECDGIEKGQPAGSIMANIEFTSRKDAEKFFKAYSVSTTK